MARLPAPVRAVLARPGLAALQVAGLAVALAPALLLAVWVQDERAYDAGHPEADRLYRVEYDVSSGGRTERWPAAEMPLATDVLPGVAGVERAFRLTRLETPTVSRGGVAVEAERLVWAEPGMFDLLDATVVQGDARRLERPGTVVLDAPTARRLFGDAEAVGGAVRLKRGPGGSAEPFRVVGVMSEMPRRSHVRAPVVASFATLAEQYADRRWARLAFTYVRLAPGAAPDAVARAVDAARGTQGEGLSVSAARTRLVPVGELHLRGAPPGEIEPQGDRRTLRLLVAVALALVVVASVTLANLAAAHGAARAREFAVRRAVGAGRGHLAAGVLAETLVVVSASVAAALGLVDLALPAVGAWTGRPLALEAEPWLWGALGAAVVGLTLGAGAYPAVALSAGPASPTLRGARRARGGVRRALVVVQFAVAVGLIVGALGVSGQVRYAATVGLGFSPGPVVVVPTEGVLTGAQRRAWGEAASRAPGVRRVAWASATPSLPSALRVLDREEIDGAAPGPPVAFQTWWVDAALPEALGLRVVRGRAFRANDPPEGVALVNQAAVAALGWTDPIGREIGEAGYRQRVVGVVGDARTDDAREEVAPLLIVYDPSAADLAVVEADDDRNPALETALARAWDGVAPGSPFRPVRLAERVAEPYRADRFVGQALALGAALASVLAALGLSGLASATVRARAHEIAVRKALGAETPRLVLGLVAETAALVAVAAVLAVPLAAWALGVWLDRFAYRAAPGAGLYLTAALLALGVAVATVAAHAVRVAAADPSAVLRGE